MKTYNGPLASLLLAIALVFAAAWDAHAQLTVNSDLNTVTAGTGIRLIGDSTIFGSQVETYTQDFPRVNEALSNLIFGSETIYEFDIAVPFQIEATKNAETVPNSNDHDILLLDGLSTGVSPSGHFSALDAIDRLPFSGPPSTVTSNGFRPGTYYLSVSTQGGLGAPGSTPPQGGPFDIDLSFIELAPVTSTPDAIDLGVVAIEGESITLDTVGSKINEAGFPDTIMALFDSDGFLLADNDDDFSLGAPSFFLSQLILSQGLEAGTYFVGVGEFRGSFGYGFEFQSDGLAGDPDITLNINGQSATGLIPGTASSDAAWFSFEVAAVPEPATAMMLMLAAACVNGVRRRVA